MFALVLMKTWELLFHAWDGKGGAVGVVTTLPHTPGLLLKFGDPYVTIICARDFSLLSKASASGTARCAWARRR